jgi:hypothetical protein
MSDAILRAEVPAESIADIDAQLQFEAAKYTSVFRTHSDAEYFAMLPLQANQKKVILMRALELERETKQT